MLILEARGRIRSQGTMKLDFQTMPMRRFLIVYTMGWVGALGGAAVGLVVLRPNPQPGPAACGMWALPPMFLVGAIGAGLMTWLGLRLTLARRAPACRARGAKHCRTGRSA
jgi:hypothetical protein